MRLNLKRYATDPVVVGSVSFCVGAAVGYFAAKKHFDGQLDIAIDTVVKFEDVVEETVTTYHPIPEAEDLKIIGVPKPEAERGRRFAEAVAAQQEAPVEEPVESTPQPHMNVFDAAAWDQEAENEDRGPNNAYVLHEDEFHNRERGFAQQVLYWYVGSDPEDKTLADENGMVIYNVNEVVGQLPFGKGSRDPDVVFIRNEKLRGEYEVHRVYESYGTAIQGIEAEEQADSDDLRHSQRITRFRTD